MKRILAMLAIAALALGFSTAQQTPPPQMGGNLMPGGAGGPPGGAPKNADTS